MTKRKQYSILAAAPNAESMARFVELLNTEEYWAASLIEGKHKIGGDYKPIRAELRRFVQAWLRSGPNVDKLFDAEPKLNQEAQKFQPLFAPTESGTARLAYLAAPEYLPHANPFDIAIGLFLPFLLNPFNENLGGPCKYCGNYFVKKTKRQFAYCSKQCGLTYTSKAAILKIRKNEWDEKLKTAKLFAAEWVRAKTLKGWKEWVSKRAQISKNWLTRAVKKGELVEPIKSHS
jgi:hypothetical protein